MTREVVFMPAARVEVIEAQDWYEKEKAGLGAEFRAEIDHQVKRIFRSSGKTIYRLLPFKPQPYRLAEQSLK